MKHLGHTEPFRGPGGSVLPGSIAEVDYLQLGGVDQWVMLRGQKRDNPPLVFLHGGPGFSEMRLFRHFNGPLESHFTVVYWDQRGTGKSFDSHIPRASMTVEQFLSDLDKLVGAVLERTEQKQVVLFGHSWGSALGVLYTARHPEKVSAYVGSGQLGDWSASEAASYSYALAEARRRHDEKTVHKLEQIGPPPHDSKKLWTERTCLQHLDGNFGMRMLEFGKIVLGGPEISLADLPNFIRGFRFSLDAMWSEVSRLNLLESAPVLQVPVFFFLGRQDHWVPPQTSLAYFDALVSPRKQLVWFEHSGHEPFADEPDKFNASMVELVRPVVEPKKN